MFRKKPQETIDSLIAGGTTIEGEVLFSGGLRIDGRVKGSVASEVDGGGMIVISETASIEGLVRAAQIYVNGEIDGTLIADELIELQPKARVRGEIRYRALEMHPGAIVDGVLAYLEHEPPALSLAAANDALPEEDEPEAEVIIRRSAQSWRAD
jgi:cytoskeletal protein CcmA (bactofilin family)